MVTRLSKPVQRSVGGLIVEISETHVTVRRKRHNQRVRFALSELAAAGDQVRPPRGWLPSAGDRVAVGGNCRRATVVSVIPAVPELMVKVRFPKGGEKTLWLSKVVPAENSKVLVECERIPRSDTTEPQRESWLFPG